MDINPAYELDKKYNKEPFHRLHALTVGYALKNIAEKAGELEDALLSLDKAEDIGAESVMIRDTVLTLMGELRLACDEAETLTAKSYWPFPTYADLLFGVK